MSVPADTPAYRLGEFIESNALEIIRDEEAEVAREALAALVSELTETRQRLKESLAREIGISPDLFTVVCDERDRVQEELRQARLLISEHHAVGAMDAAVIGNDCPVCARRKTER